MPADHGGDEDGATTPGAARRAVVLAGYRGDVTAARSGSGHADPEVRAAALGALDRLGELTAGDLAAALGDPAAPVRRRAARLSAGRAEMVAALVALLDDDEPSVAEEAAFALGESGPGGSGPGGSARAEAVRALSAMARDHDDALCRESAVAALGSLGDPAGLDAVLAGCGDRATVRRRAVLALAAFEGPRVTEALEALAADRDLQVRQAAEDLLAIERGHAT